MRFSDKATLSTNSRITTLLKRVSVEDRLVTQKSSVEELMNREMDYTTIQDRLSKFRNESLQYLKKALEN